MSQLRALCESRATSVVMRSLHVATMAVLVGGVAFAAPVEALRWWIWLTVGTGVLLAGSDLLAGRFNLTHGSGVVMLLKLALLAVGIAVPAQRLPWFLVATFIAGIGSHMPAPWRHFSFVAWRTVERKRR